MPGRGQAAAGGAQAVAHLRCAWNTSRRSTLSQASKAGSPSSRGCTLRHELLACGHAPPQPRAALQEAWPCCGRLGRQQMLDTGCPASSRPAWATGWQGLKGRRRSKGVAQLVAGGRCCVMIQCEHYPPLLLDGHRDRPEEPP